MSRSRIRKAVFPVAGLGTRFLPATKTVPKEMLPIIDKPLIQYAVDEAVEAGCDTLVFVTNRYKHAVADYFDKAYELEQKLEKAGKTELLELIRNVLPPHVRAVFVTQAEALGLGHAVLCAKPVVGDEPFAVLLPDDLIWNRGPGALKQMADARRGVERQRDRGAGRAARRRPAATASSPPSAFAGRQGRITRDRREARARSRAQHAGGGRPLRAQPAHLRPARSDPARRRRRDPAHRRDRRAAGGRGGQRLSLPGHALRLRHAPGPDRGHHPLRARPREAQRCRAAPDAERAGRTGRRRARAERGRWLG